MSTDQIQTEMLKKARWDGGWPRAVCLFPGVVALARNQEELDKFNRENEVTAYAMLAVLAVVFVGVLVFGYFWVPGKT